MVKHVLVTGGAGFVGRHLVHALLERGDEVLAVDSFEVGSGALGADQWFFDVSKYGDRWIGVQEQDIRDFVGYGEANGFDEIYHCAAVVGGRNTIDGSPLRVAEDLGIDAAVIRWVAETGDPEKTRFCYFSSSAAYSVAQQTENGHVPLAEDYLDLTGYGFMMPDYTYGWAKMTGEYLCKVACDKHNLRCHIFRPFSGYGEDQDLNYPFMAIAHRAWNAWSQDSDHFSVWGSGLQRRDFIHIDDIVRIVLDRMVNKPAYCRPMNLGTGVSTSFIQLAGMMADAIDPEWRPKIVADPWKPVGVFSRVANVGKMQSAGYRADINILGGVRRAMQKVIHG